MGDEPEREHVGGIQLDEEQAVELHRFLSEGLGRHNAGDAYVTVHVNTVIEEPQDPQALARALEAEFALAEAIPDDKDPADDSYAEEQYADEAPDLVEADLGNGTVLTGEDKPVLAALLNEVQGINPDDPEDVVLPLLSNAGMEKLRGLIEADLSDLVVVNGPEALAALNRLVTREVAAQEVKAILEEIEETLREERRGTA